MVVLCRNTPEFESRGNKYVWYYELFGGVEDQKNRIVCLGSNGYGAWQELDVLPTEPVPKDEYFCEYLLDDQMILCMNRAELTISGEGFDDLIFDSLNDPDTVRLVFDNASHMGITEKVVKNEDGTINLEDTPSYHSIKFIFDELPSDKIFWSIKIIGLNDVVLRTASDTLEVFDSPYDIVEE